MRVYIAADHAGFYLKKSLIQYLKIKGYEVEDCGAFEMNEDDDYPDFIIPCAQKVVDDTGSLGIVIGGSGQGEAIAANKVKGIRAAVFYGPSTHSTNSVQASSGQAATQIPKLAREHNDANILSLGARFISGDDAKKAVTSWLEAKFEGGRHVARLKKIEEVEGGKK
ncbi:hypothetical protein A2696_00225 [Candidatus Curtissbacteria bacterium RIFCSPHIGHO2_01_FULL_41_13]|uniref:Ribose-5-phosphate isomerase n=1 Tax=Candidatus Curtissbacteria bacterium RIFCSPHIGHO2_01_FULL_41_13 TaxID=1797745 RepID=A0A1F5G016_9BACT|nr:MAG: hypothetical protein A2696_00225 [Candidatus Curtissbacteria bacterium RIFCSPHIGHO2_01_FULL_41_13]